MKKFLSKKPVMIAFVAVAVVFLAVYIGMLVRPVSYGFNYTQTVTEKVSGKEYKQTTKLNIKSDKVARQTIISEVDGKEESKMVGDVWIYRDGNKILIIGAKEMIESTEMSKSEIKEFNKMNTKSESEYKDAVKALEEMKEETPDLYKLRLKTGTEVSLFVFGEDDKETKDIDESFLNVQAIVFTVIHGIVTVALLTFGTLSVLYYVKGRKK